MKFPLLPLLFALGAMYGYTCLGLSFPSGTANATASISVSSSENFILVYIGIAAGVLLLIVAVAGATTLYCFLQCRKMKAEEEGKGFADLDITRRIVFGADHSQTFNKAITDVKLVEKYKNRLFKEKVCTEYGVFKESGVFNNKVTFFADFFVKTSVQEADELRTSCNAIYRVHVRPLNRCPPTLPFLSPYFTFLYVLTPVRATHWKIPEIYNFSAIRTVYEKMQTVMDFEKDNIYFPKVYGYLDNGVEKMLILNYTLSPEETTFIKGNKITQHLRFFTTGIPVQNTFSVGRQILRIVRKMMDFGYATPLHLNMFTHMTHAPVYRSMLFLRPGWRTTPPQKKKEEEAAFKFKGFVSLDPTASLYAPLSLHLDEPTIVTYMHMIESAIYVILRVLSHLPWVDGKNECYKKSLLMEQCSDEVIKRTEGGILSCEQDVVKRICVELVSVFRKSRELKREPVDIIERLIQILENGERITHENAVKYYENFVSVDKNWTDSFKRKADQADEDDEEESQPLLMSSDPKDQ
ncbi:hypothetical protein QR680_007532 [Steinernema hermaphroditum]|uniref:Uncharacterized protein n=1 Tax=Steinernema hermaphroditum TaxID=289476 RepID=A0AA39IDG9_9BILA|nr:hypothetical protein QR680_007532 [Steinernema hermaphroditum]